MNIMGNLPIGELGERAIIDRFIVPLLSDEMGNILLDDCAVVKLPAPASLLLSTDQGPSHTFLDLLGVGTPADIGHFHVTINASDIAAMGGRPLGILMVLALTGCESQNYLASFLSGVREAMSEYGLRLLGGDTKQSSCRTTTITIIGTAHELGLLQRKGAQPDDRIFVTPGEIGEVLHNYIMAARSNDKRRVVRPKAQIEFGQRLVAARIATSCIDMSDGIIASAEQLAKLNNVTFHLNPKMLRCALSPSPGLAERWNNLVLNVGGDFGLMFTSAPENAANALNLGAREIGEVTSYNEDWLNKRELKTLGIQIRGWEQFRTTVSISDEIRSFV
jgi:thiamine-monophosphate kinase